MATIYKRLIKEIASSYQQIYRQIPTKRIRITDGKVLGIGLEQE